LHEYGKVVATVAEKHPERWLSSVENNGHGLTHEEVIPPEVQAREMLLMGLRISEGVSLSRYVSMAGRAIPHQTLAMLADLGMLTMKDNDRLTATPRGRRVLNAVIAELVE
jgi:oxygen-independent coproporphyrinogen-3 oxidase